MRAIMTALELKQEFVQAIGHHERGEISIDDLYQCADRYIAALIAYKKKTGKRFNIPSRAYLIRAFR